jgi:hypothetical protein
VLLYAAIDIHKQAFQAAVLDPESGEVVEERFSADRWPLRNLSRPPAISAFPDGVAWSLGYQVSMEVRDQRRAT